MLISGQFFTWTMSLTTRQCCTWAMFATWTIIPWTAGSMLSRSIWSRSAWWGRNALGYPIPLIPWSTHMFIWLSTPIPCNIGIFFSCHLSLPPPHTAQMYNKYGPICFRPGGGGILAPHKRRKGKKIKQKIYRKNVNEEDSFQHYSRLLPPSPQVLQVSWRAGGCARLLRDVPGEGEVLGSHSNLLRSLGQHGHKDSISDCVDRSFLWPRVAVFAETYGSYFAPLVERVPVPYFPAFSSSEAKGSLQQCSRSWRRTGSWYGFWSQSGSGSYLCIKKYR